MTKYIVAQADEIPVGGRKIVEINGRSIGVFNVNGEYFALLNRCPHAGAELCTGTITGLRRSEKPGEYLWDRSGEIVRCPWHGWEFDIKTGQSWFDPEKVRVRPYPVTVEPNLNAVESGLYSAETFAVKVENEVVVVDLAGKKNN